MARKNQYVLYLDKLEKFIESYILKADISIVQKDLVGGYDRGDFRYIKMADPYKLVIDQNKAAPRIEWARSECEALAVGKPRNAPIPIYLRYYSS